MFKYQNIIYQTPLEAIKNSGKDDNYIYFKQKDEWEDIKYKNGPKFNSFGQKIKVPLKFGINVTKLFLKKNLISVPIEDCSNQYAFSYGDNGWHYFKDLAIQIINNPDVNYTKTKYYKFFNNCNCSSYSSLMTLHDQYLRSNLPDIPFGSYPWGSFDSRENLSYEDFKDKSKNRKMQYYMWFESGCDFQKVLHREYKAIFDLIKSIIVNGYNPKYSCYMLPIAVIMKKKSGEVKIIQRDGAHRLSVLSALGFKRITMQLDPIRYPPILEEDVGNWFYVKNGLITKLHALKIFELYFQLNGKERKNILLPD